MKLGQPTGFAAFTVVWAGQLVSTLGTRMTNFALSIWIWQATGRASDLALMTLCAFGATVVCSPIAGSLIDRWNRRLTIALSDLGAAVATGALLLMFLTGSVSVWHLYAVNIVTGAFLAFQMPAFSATITLMMVSKNYPKANAMLSLARSTPAIFAPGIAAALLVATNVETILILDVVSCLVAVAFIYLVAIPQPPAQTGGEQRSSMWRDSAYGFIYIWRRPGFIGLQAIGFAIGLFAAMSWIVLTPLVMARGGGSEANVGLVQSVGAIGGVLGGVLMGVLKPTRNKMLRVLLAIAVFSVFGRILFGVGDTLLLWCASWFVAWMCIPFIDGYSQAIWQEKVEPAVQGRVFAARQLIDNLTMPIALGIAGPLADFYLEPAMRPGGQLAGVFGGLVGTGPGAGMALIFLFTGVLGVLVAAAGFASRTVRDIERSIPDHDATGTDPATAEVATEAAAPSTVLAGASTDRSGAGRSGADEKEG